MIVFQCFPDKKHYSSSKGNFPPNYLPDRISPAAERPACGHQYFNNYPSVRKRSIANTYVSGHTADPKPYCMKQDVHNHHSDAPQTTHRKWYGWYALLVAVLTALILFFNWFTNYFS